MDMIMSIFTRTMNCLEGICNDIERNIDSGCCQTHKQIHVSEQKNGQANEEIKNEFKKKDFKK